VKFNIKAGLPEQIRCDCVVVGLSDTGRLQPAGLALDRASSGHLKKVLKAGDLSGKVGKSLLLHGISGINAARVLVVGTGSGKLSDTQFRKVVRSVAAALDDKSISTALLCLEDLPSARDEAWKLEQAVLVIRDATYRINKISDQADPAHAVKEYVLGVNKAVKALATTVSRAEAIANGMDLAKDLAHLPGNICTPTYLANQAQAIAKRFKLKAEILEQSHMEKLGMGSLLSVSAGSRQPPKLITLKYQGGAKTQKPIVLVGKGITFDTGGISLKPSAGLEGMKYDMSGAASVLGTLQAVAEMQLPINVIGVIPSCENMPDGNATRPGDIVRSMAGKTIEITNTDAEGRLVLCDALTYSRRFEPETIIDVATLTGACVVALGKEASGLFTKSPKLLQELQAASDYSGDRAWSMPLYDEYLEAMKSTYADLNNAGGRDAGACTAAAFLSAFTEGLNWAHLDIAGTAGKPESLGKGSSGRPVPLFCRFLIERSGG
jgi:leucyl aminopeptidase